MVEENKEAFEAWCDENATTMSEEVRRRIEACVMEGKLILAQRKQTEQKSA